MQQSRVEYKTIHSSKGLQADYVILLGLNTGGSAFPSEKEDDPLINLVLPQPETHAYAEERRLFYVALTRAKESFSLVNVILYSLKKLLKTQALRNLFIYRKMTIRLLTMIFLINGDVQNVSKVACGKTGPYGEFMACNRYPSCDHKRSLRYR